MSATEDGSSNIEDENTTNHEDENQDTEDTGNILVFGSKKTQNTSGSPNMSTEGKGSGDYSDKAKISDEIKKKVDADSFLEKDEGDDIEDDDLTLRWDDDDGSQPLGDDKDNSETKNSENLSEEQLLEESLDAIVKESTAKLSEDNFDDDSVNNVLIQAKEITDKTINSPKQDISKDNIDAKNIDNMLEEELLEVSDTETEIIPEKDINDLENELLEELDNDPSEFVNKAKDNIDDQKDKPSEMNPKNKDKDISKIDKLDTVEDNILFSDSESKDTPSTEFKIKSFTDTIFNQDSEELEDKFQDSEDLEDNILEEAEAFIQSSGIIADDTQSQDLEDSEDALLEDTILDEIKSAEKMLAADIAMDVDDEGELLKDDESRDGIAQMDIDNNQSIEKTDQSDLTKEKDTLKDQIDDKATAEMNIVQPSQEPAEIESTERIVSGETVTDDIDEQRKADDKNQVTDSSLAKESTSGPVDKKSTSDETIQKENIEKSLPEEAIQLENDKEITETKTLDKTLENADTSAFNTSTVFEDSPVPIKTKHGLHKPDVMLEIPTQELIDIDTDLSLDLDQSEVLDTSLDDVVDEKVESLEKSAEIPTNEDSRVTEIVEAKVTVMTDKPVDQNATVSEKSKTTDAILSEECTETDISSQETVIIGTLEPDATVSQDAIVSDNIINRALVSEKEVQESIVEENIASKDVLASDTTVNKESVEVENAVSQESKIDENFASQDAIQTDKAVTEGTKIKESIAPQDVVASDTTKETPVTEKNKEIIVEENVAPEGATDTTITKDKPITKKIASEVTMADKPLVEVEKGKDSTKDKDVPETIEQSMERMFADDDPAKDIVEALTTEQPVQSSTSTTLTPDTSEQMPQVSDSLGLIPDTSDEVPEVSDSLGLLAESAGRMMEDDEEAEDEDDDDDDFDQDESSNQISAEQSEDSNPPILETEASQQGAKEFDTPDPKDEEFQFPVQTGDKDNDKMDTQFGDVELPAESINDEETKTAVDALLRDGLPAEEQTPEENADQMDIETVKLSDTSDNEGEGQTARGQIEAETDKVSEEKQATQSPSKQSPSKMKKLEITTQEPSSVVNYVDLEESSEDEIQEVEKQPEQTATIDKPTTPETDSVTNVNIPSEIEIMCTSGSGSTSEIVTKEKEVVISGVPKPPPQKTARLNTSEVSIKTASNTEPLVIPETKIIDASQTTSQAQPKGGLEIFSLDSDDEDSSAKEKPETPHKMTALELEKARESSKCINYCCLNGSAVPFIPAEPAVVAYYDAGRKRRSMVCLPCAQVVADRNKNLIRGIKNLTPLLDLEMAKLSQDLVEISDSESEDEDMTPDEPKESIGEEGAKFVEDNLVKYLNDTWKKYDMDNRLKETQIMLDEEIEKMERDSVEIDAMLNECQAATDKLRNELYATFECRRHELPPIILYDTPDTKFVGFESDPYADSTVSSTDTADNRQAKRRLSSSSEVPAKRPAIPLGYTPLDTQPTKDPKAAIPLPDVKMDDDKDISVVKLSAEAAPAELPPPGEISRPPLRVSMAVYAMKNAFGPWLKGKVLDIQPKNPSAGAPFSVCRIKFDHKRQANGKVLPARCIAYSEPADVRMTIGTRLIALFKDSSKRESFYSGVVAEIPNPVNSYRYLVFFDDGYAQYVEHKHTRLVCESSPLVWEEVHPFSREFVREYLMAYPERPMVRLHEGQHLKTEWNGKWWSSRVTKVDASLAQVLFVGDGRREWIYRGSTRLAPLYLELRAAERHRPRPMPRNRAQPRLNMPYVEYTRSDEQDTNKQTETQTEELAQQQQNEEIRRQRAVAKKSTAAVQPPPVPQAPGHVDTVTSRVVYYTPKNAVKPYKMTPHKCGPKCKRSDVLSLKELRTYNPLAKPLLSGWERQIVRFKGHKEVMYRAPCGRRLRNVRELHRYLRAVACDLPVDLFDFHPATHCLAEFVLNKCRVGKKDLSHGKENVPVPCVNYYDDSLPEFCSYNTERTPTAGVPLNLDPEFLCGCDCVDDCQDKSKCACWKMTLEGARTIGLEGPNVGYVYKRLPEPLPSGIYECNSRCKCKNTCLNRVAQHPLQLKLQVFKTLNRGWGIRALNDVPKGSFLCVYAGNLLTDATANLDGLNEGDEYLAELDYIEVVEQMKEGYEEDIPEADKKLDRKEGKDGDSDENETSSSDEEDNASKTDKEDDDFRPGHIGLGLTEFNKRLRKRERNKKDKEKSETDEKEKEKDSKDTKDSKDKDTKESNADEDCITISDDEEVREPSRFNVQAGMGASEFISKYKSVRTLFGKDEACYIMDAKVQGNIGRYLNHSCCPNVFVQNVFVDTHDPRFPWVAFFALSHIKAGTELTWNYNYDVGSVPGKVLYCHCGAPNCRGRLL
ncbi:histone-lysine N-methyltransferase SETDB1-A isoform X2 [Helicoverpa zea]|uniref:histone-lysine N-methyltransferase SETDB1-A isoform X2 n=1 Tax=Helicoverpa zea TaxID=7113 RepID=UPI001F5AB008|nr:histone-lysine N-methyltransferase SETDB1-A isoform X2 [Helicoverpa zea]